MANDTKAGIGRSGAPVVGAEGIGKAYGPDPILTATSLGVLEGERIGVVGRNGAGKTTLLRLLAGLETPDTGRVTRPRGQRIGVLEQHDALDPALPIVTAVVGDRAEHEWLADRRIRDVLGGLLSDLVGVGELFVGSAGSSARAYGRSVGELSGGERRRVDLARLLVGAYDLILLDEPTNHLDLEVTDWLARHLAGRPEAMVAVSHDRWFLDAVCTSIWEVADATVRSYDGGYAAYTLARAERARVAEATETRRQNLLRKELAWLHRGARARTTKAKYRVDAAEALIADEPPPRDRLELAKFAAARLGKTVLELADVDVRPGDRTLLTHLDWQLGPGDRVGIVGVNGAGKTSLLRVLAGEVEPATGRLVTGRTVRLAHLAQGPGSLDPNDTVLAAAEAITTSIRTAPTNIRPGAVGRRPVPAHGPEVTTSSLLQNFGFAGERLQTRVGDLSGGERRKLELLCLLLDEPNVLLLDEPTNDLDIEALQVIEDLLDSWPGSVVVVTHDRYFLERVSDTVWGLLGDGRFGLLPGGVEEYLERRRRSASRGVVAGVPADGDGRDDGDDGDDGEVRLGQPAERARRSDAAALRDARKELARVERRLARLTDRETELHEALAANATEYERLMELDEELRALGAEKDELENRWLELAEAAE